jgi:DNA gyrase/topoisomerase IV subunit B
MRFADQNKTKYAVSRAEIEPEMIQRFKARLLSKIRGSELEEHIKQEIENRLYDQNIKKIKQSQKASKRKISEKYTSATKIKEFLYVAEGQSAAGGVKQSRNSERDGVYALKGKIKNTRTLSDLTDNKEILEIMSLLGIEPGVERPPSYQKIVIAADEDMDGHHISALIVHFFHKWFPYIIREGRLKRLVTPLVAADHGKNRVYFYSLREFSEYSKKYKVSGIAYLKGLGSLSLQDWEYVMKNRVLLDITLDDQADKYLDIAFGSSSGKRKLWLEGKC